jgi:hypothetical protein
LVFDLGISDGGVIGDHLCRRRGQHPLLVRQGDPGHTPPRPWRGGASPARRAAARATCFSRAEHPPIRSAAPCPSTLDTVAPSPSGRAVTLLADLPDARGGWRRMERSGHATNDGAGGSVPAAWKPPRTLPVLSDTHKSCIFHSIPRSEPWLKRTATRSSRLTRIWEAATPSNGMTSTPSSSKHSMRSASASSPSRTARTARGTKTGTAGDVARTKRRMASSPWWPPAWPAPGRYWSSTLFDVLTISVVPCGPAASPARRGLTRLERPERPDRLETATMMDQSTRGHG